VKIVAAELQLWTQSTPITLSPGSSNNGIALIYGPLDDTGIVSSSFGGSFRPGISYQVQLTSSDPSIFTIPKPVITVDKYVTIPLSMVAPGRAQVLVQAPPQITNRAAAVDIVVTPFRFYSPALDSAARYLVSKVVVTNPRAQPTALTLNSDGQTPLRFGTSGASSITLKLAPGETQTTYLEPGPGNLYSASFLMSAPDFSDNEVYVYFSDPQAMFSPSASVTVPLDGGTTSIAIVLADRSSSRELPLGASYGPLQIQLQSSNSQVVQVPADPIAFTAGDSRKAVTLQLKSRGDAIITLIMPAGFAGNSSSRQDLVVSVR
jgi:hypothetical protein